MRFLAKTEQELMAYQLLQPGTYPFSVTKAEECVSKSGNEMIKLTITIWETAGSSRQIFDYLLEAMPLKLRGFALATGMPEKYNSGEIKASDCENKEGYVQIGIEPGKPKEDGTLYPARNSVKAYTTLKEEIMKPVDNGLNDDIPF